MEVDQETDWLLIDGIRELNQSNALALRERVNAVLTDAVKIIVLDLSQTVYLDSQGLGAIIAFHNRMRRRNGVVRLLDPSPLVQQALELTRLHRVFDIVNEVLADPALHLDVFAYDLNEPDLCKALLALAQQGRIRVILDSSVSHHNNTPKPIVPEEDQFEAMFTAQAAAPAAIARGMFARFAHDKVFIVSKAGVARKVLTGE